MVLCGWFLLVLQLLSYIVVLPMISEQADFVEGSFKLLVLQ